MKEALKLALEALENSVDLVVEDAYNAEQLYGNYPTRQGKVGGLKVLAEQHKQAITFLREALAQPEHIGFMDSKLNPIQRTWVGLTKDEVEILAYKAEGNTWIAVELTETKLKEKNT